MGGPDNIAGLRIDPISTSDALQPFHCPLGRHIVEFIRFLSRLRLRDLLGVSPWLTDSLRSEEHTSELQSLMRISYAVFCLKKKKTTNTHISRATIRIKQINNSNKSILQKYTTT